MQRFNTFIILQATLSAPSRPCPCKKSHPVLVKYRDQDGNVKMTMVKQPKSNQNELSSWGSDSNVSVDSSEEASHEEASLDESADLQQYAERDGPHEDSDDMNEKYNISDEDDLEHAEVYNESDDGNVYGHAYNPNIHSSESSEEQEATVPKKDCHHKKSPKPQPHSNKRVYIYKQPPIIVNPKPTNVYIRSKPIVVRPPPLVVHQAAPKPCNPVIKYQPPNIKIRPVIVKISKAKPTTTTTTPCPTTTRKPKPCTTTKKPKPCRKHKKPSKKCGRCQKNKSRTVYYNQHDFVAPDHQYVKQYKNLPCHDDIYT